MDPKIEKELNQLNYDFYEKIGKYWNNNPDYEWDGWSHLVAPIKELKERLGRRLRVLDLGCGNGRFLHWLNKNIGEVGYVGVDFSDYLLGVAKENDKDKKGRFVQSDLFLDEWDFLDDCDSFDVVVSFGLIHHIPSTDLVKKFFTNFNRLIINQDTMGVITVWNYHLLDRLNKKILGREELSENFQDNLGPNENILAWNKEDYSTRFSRYFDKEEVLDYLGSDIRLLDFYMDDDRNKKRNSYFVFSKK